MQKIKLLAVQRDRSASGLLSAELEKLVDHEDVYSRAHQRHLAHLEAAADLATDGQVDSSRDELHER